MISLAACVVVKEVCNSWAKLLYLFPITMKRVIIMSLIPMFFSCYSQYFFHLYEHKLNSAMKGIQHCVVQKQNIVWINMKRPRYKKTMSINTKYKQYISEIKVLKLCLHYIKSYARFLCFQAMISELKTKLASFSQ